LDPDTRPVLKRRRVLVVEDDYLQAEDLTLALEDRGATVMGPIASVEGALSLLDSGELPDAALLDVDIDGTLVFAVVDRLREHGIPVMFVTGYDLGSLPQAYADVPHCEKPCAVDLCLDTLFRPAHA